MGLPLIFLLQFRDFRFQIPVHRIPDHPGEADLLLRGEHFESSLVLSRHADRKALDRFSGDRMTGSGAMRFHHAPYRTILRWDAILKGEFWSDFRQPSTQGQFRVRQAIKTRTPLCSEQRRLSQIPTSTDRVRNSSGACQQSNSLIFLG